MGISKRYKRRHRRQANAAMRHGKEAKPRHALKSGRTGSVMSKRLRSRRYEDSDPTISLP